MCHDKTYTPDAMTLDIEVHCESVVPWFGRCVASVDGLVWTGTIARHDACPL